MKTKSLVGLLVSALVLVGGSFLSGCHSDASCGDVCKHELGCLGGDTSDVSKCVSVCEQAAVATPDWRNRRVMTDCSLIAGGANGPGNVDPGTSGNPGASGDPWADPSTGTGDPSTGSGDPSTSSGDPSGSSSSGCYPDGHTCSAGGDCCNGNCIDASVNQWICY